MPTKCFIDNNSKKEFVGYSNFAGKKFSVVRCKSCNFCYIDMPDVKLKKILDNYYGKGSFEDEKVKKIFLKDFRESLSRLLGLFYCEDDSRMKFLMRNGVSKKMSIFDLGCGPGTFIIWLEKKGFKVNGFEPDLEKTIIANKYLKNGKAKKGFVDDAFLVKADVYSLVHVLEHLVKPDQFLSELKKKHPKSMLFLEIPNCESKKYLDISMSFPHNYHFDSKNVAKLLKKTGWKIVSIEKSDSNQMVPRSWRKELPWLFFRKDICSNKKTGSALRILAK